MSAKPTSHLFRWPVFGWPIIAVTTTALAVVVPFFFFGIPSGHDFEFHMNSWMEVVEHWKAGTVVPGWAGLAHFGYGEPRFIFYPPFSWMLGGLLGALLPWTVVPATYVFLALTSSGLSMFLLARSWMRRNDAILAACLYAGNPYHLVIIYWRSAYAELLAAALLPLLLLFLLRLGSAAVDQSTLVIPLSLIVAGACLSNIPAAVMVNHSLMMFTAAIAVRRRSWRVLGVGTLAAGIGMCLAAFCLLPAIYEQRWVNISEVLSPGVRPADNFLFTRISDADHNRFNLLVSSIAVCEMIGVAIAALRSGKKCHRQEIWRYAALWSLASAIVMVSVSSLAWRYFPELKFVQFPWRWLLCLNVGFAIFVPFAWRHWSSRLAICAIMLLTVGLVWHRVQQPWWDNAADIAEMSDNQQSGAGYEGTDEYVPSGADASEIAQDAPQVTLEDHTAAQVHVEQWTAESKLLKVNADHPGKILLHLFNYPSWKVKVNGRVIRTESSEVTRQMIIPVPMGVSTVTIAFERTWDRWTGMLISLFTVVLLFLGHRVIASRIHAARSANA